MRRYDGRSPGASPPTAGDAHFIGIDVIVRIPRRNRGARFPGTYDFLAELKPAFLHIFPFSRRPGTPAVESARQSAVVGRHAPRRRTRSALRTASRRILCPGRRVRGYGHSSKAICRGGMMFGFTGNYRRVRAPTTQRASTPSAASASGRWMRRTTWRAKSSMKCGPGRSVA